LCMNRLKSCIVLILYAMLMNGLNELHGQGMDSSQAWSKPEVRRVPDKFSLLLYARVISDAHQNYRTDENVVANFKLNRLLRIEAGIRQGERPGRFDSYFHYKLEVQTKSFWKTVRVIARVSDNVIKYPAPVFSKSNFLMVAEARIPIAHRFSALVAGGYVYSFQRPDNQEASPSINGTMNSYPTYKLAIQYELIGKGHIGLVYGAYDVFNPYLIESPFVQVDSEFELSRRVGFYGYFRYQFDKSFLVPLNDFLGFGVRVHVIKG